MEKNMVRILCHDNGKRYRRDIGGHMASGRPRVEYIKQIMMAVGEDN